MFEVYKVLSQLSTYLSGSLIFRIRICWHLFRKKDKEHGHLLAEAATISSQRLLHLGSLCFIPCSGMKPRRNRDAFLFGQKNLGLATLAATRSVSSANCKKMQRGAPQPSCFDRVKLGFGIGFAVGMSSAALFGTYSALR